MTKGRLLLNPKLAMLVTNRYSKLFKIDSTFKKQLAKYLKENNIRIINREYLNFNERFFFNFFWKHRGSD